MRDGSTTRESEIQVEFLGSGDAFGSGGRFQTCISVRSSNERFLIDCGASSLIAMRRAGISLLEVEKILVTHLHGDHFGGIPFFLLDAQLVSKRERPLMIIGPPGLQDRVYSSMEVLFPGSSKVKREFGVEFIELEPHEEQRIGELSITGYPVIHFSGAPPYALRIELQGRVIVYSGDTEWTDELIEASRGADLFICEAYFYDKAVKFHLDYRTLISHRPELACDRIVLTHMNEDMLAKLDRIELEHAEDGKRIVL